MTDRIQSGGSVTRGSDVVGWSSVARTFWSALSSEYAGLPTRLCSKPRSPAALFAKQKRGQKCPRHTIDRSRCELRGSYALVFHDELLSTAMQLNHLLHFGH